jgi:NAD(P)-dependent dehydrogenase (short-subunit alcohol dehydrogenase family)
MKIEGAIVIVTGGANGIGEALAAAAVRAGARGVVVSDRDTEGAVRVAEKLAAYGPRASGAASTVVAEGCDVADETAVNKLVAFTEERFGRVDLVCSNAGIMLEGGPELASSEWDRSWRINVMGHVFAANAALPGMLARGSGYFLNTVSAAGMLSSPGAASYAATKHAALGFAEWLALTYGDRGIGVTALCPELVNTAMVKASIGSGNAAVRLIAETSLTLDTKTVAEAALKGVEESRFLVTTHPDTLRNTQRKWSDVDRWLKGMTRFVRSAG